MRASLMLMAAGTILAGCAKDHAPAKETGSTTTTTSTAAGAAAGGDSMAAGAEGRSPEELAELARRVVTTSIRVRPGDVVVIDGGKHTIGLMEAMAIEAEKAGGLPNMWLESARVVRSLVTEVPDKYLDLKPSYLAEWYRHMTVWIGLGAFEDAKPIFSDVPERKLAKLAATSQVIYDMLNASPIRGAYIDYPTTGSAAEVGLPFDRYSAMQWAAIGADYTRIAAAGAALRDRLQSGQVHITSPSGTDLTFSLGRRPVILNAGIISETASKEKLLLNRFVTLPGGLVQVAPVETSVRGVLVISKDRCKFKPLRDARYEFSNGTLTKAAAKDGDDCLQENLRTYGAGVRRLGAFSLGLNPAQKPIEDDADYRPASAAGMVVLRLGDNQLLGGSNKVAGGVTIDIPVTRATVALDGRKVIENGQLTAAGPASASR